MRVVRICTVLFLLFAVGHHFVDVAAAETAQQRQQRQRREAEQRRAREAAQKKAQQNKGQKRPVTNNVPATPLPTNVRVYPDGSAGLPGVKTVDVEGDFTVADDATVQQLTKFPSGLNFVGAAIGDLREGLLVTLTLKGDKVENVSGTITKLTDSNHKITLKMTLPSGQTAPDQGERPCTMVSIRTAVDKKADN